MHELSIAEAIVEACAERADGARVQRVRLEIGKLAGVVPDSIRFCFEVCVRDTPLDGAELEIVEIAGRGVCRTCHGVIELETLLGSCACGSTSFDIVTGEELRVKDMELA